MPAQRASTRSSRVIISVLVVALLTAAVLLGRWFLSNPTCGSPPSKEAIVRALLDSRHDEIDELLV